LAVWSALADTARFNEAAGFPKHRITEAPQADGSVAYVGEAKIGPFTLAWDDLPVEWVTGRVFRHARAIRNGPLRSLVATLTLHPDGAGCRADYRVEIEPRGLAGGLLVAPGFLRGAGRTYLRLAAQAAAFASGAAAQPFEFPPAKLDEERSRRLAAAREAMIRDGAERRLVERLGQFVVEGPEIDLMHLRPLALARAWGEPERPVIETCLHGVKAGLLTLHWDLLCPNCRGPKLTAGTLDRLPTGAHCATCNIDYERDFARNVELTFRPAPTVREVVDGQFCLFGPLTTPHVLVQQTLAPGETREVDAPVGLEPGEYRLRGLHPGGEAVVAWQGGGFPAIEAIEADVIADEPAPPGRVRLINRRASKVTLVLESRLWVRDALTAARVTSLQAFRDLFASEALRPGDDVAVGRVTLMFTDLRGSTSLYARIGDGAAYRLVREHFAYLADAVRRHDGGIVKTIGDAVMAAFSDPAQAVAAALEIQRNVARFNASIGADAERGLAIKLGLHVGPAIAVTLNDRLDYFGQTVNLAARLQGQSRGGDIVMSAQLLAEPGVAALVEAIPGGDEVTQLKGIDAPVAFRRLTPEPS
jgi:class 3 adenylate cyclase